MPEEDIPVKIIGKITLNKNMDNFFAEVEQVAFHPGHVVPGIDFTNDPLLQGRLFSYTDTQLIRLGGPNFHELPINRPINPIHNNQRDGYGRQTIDKNKIAYHNNSLADNTPKTVSAQEGGFEHYQEKVEGKKIRARSDSFKDHFSQAKMFYNSMSPVEQQHIIDAFSFELSKVKSKDIRQQVVDMMGNVNKNMMTEVATNIGVKPPKGKEVEYDKVSPALSQENTIKKPDTLKVGVIVAQDFDENELALVLKQLKEAKTSPEIISETLQDIKVGKDKISPKHTLLSADPVLLDSIYVIGGKKLNDKFKSDAKRYIKETYMHFKPLAVSKSLEELLEDKMKDEPGVSIINKAEKDLDKFIEDISMHRHWDRNINI